MAQPQVELRILGPTELHGPVDRTGSYILRQPKRLALLAYLALATSDGYRRRDQIVALFWPDLDQAHARTQLRKVLHALRRTIGPEAFSKRGEEEIRLGPSQVWCDAVAFARCIEAGQWAEALALYRGDLLEGFFPGGVSQELEAWLEDQRVALRAQAARATWECSSLEDLAGRRVEALALARRAVDLDPDNEEGVRRLLAVLDRHGDRAGALRLYAAWQTRLQSEYGAEPAPETRKLARKVQAHRKGDSADTPATLTPANPARVPIEGTAPWSHIGIASAVLALAAVAAIGLMISARNRGRDAANGDARFAVLPLRGLGDSSDVRVGEGLAEELTTALAQLTDIVVRSTARSRDAVRAGGDVSEIGHRLGVDYVLDGSVQHATQRLRVTARVVRVRDETTIWAEAFDIGDADLIAAEERIAAVIVDSVRSRLAHRGTRP
jgi:serine/threonine-protein kinase